MPVGFHPDFGSPVNYRIESLPEDPDGQVRRTMKIVRAYLRDDARHPFILDHARQIGLRGVNPTDDILTTWKHVKQSMRFQQDEDSAKRLETSDSRIPDVIEVVVRPIDQALLIQMRGQGFEDCDGYELYAGCLLTAAGIPASLVTVWANDESKGKFDHVYLVAYPNGYGKAPRIPLDFSHGEFPGWECPNLGRLKEWPIKVTVSEVLCDAILPVGLLVGAYWGLRYLEKERAA